MPDIRHRVRIAAPQERVYQDLTTVEFMYHCSTKWAYHLPSLKSGLEGRRYSPFPHGQDI